MVRSDFRKVVVVHQLDLADGLRLLPRPTLPVPLTSMNQCPPAGSGRIVEERARSN